MSVRTKAPVDYVELHVHIKHDTEMSPWPWQWAVSDSAETPQYWSLYTLADGLCMTRAAARFFGRRACRRIARQRIHGDVHEHFTYEAWRDGA